MSTKALGPRVYPIPLWSLPHQEYTFSLNQQGPDARVQHKGFPKAPLGHSDKGRLRAGWEGHWLALLCAWGGEGKIQARSTTRMTWVVWSRKGCSQQTPLTVGTAGKLALFTNRDPPIHAG